MFDGFFVVFFCPINISLTLAHMGLKSGKMHRQTNQHNQKLVSVLDKIY